MSDPTPADGRESLPLSLRNALRRIAIGGSLAMVYATGVGSPATTEYFRALGADEWHFGLIGGLPLVMLIAQFFGAARVNRARKRRLTFFFCLIACRLLYLPIAFVPWDRSGWPPAARMTCIIGMLSLSALLHNYAIPFWFSWMADLIPRPILNRFWGQRQRAMHLTWTMSFLLVTLYLYFSRQPIAWIFRVLVGVAVTAGVIDIALFFRIHEPANVTDHQIGWWQAIREPWRDSIYRTFVLYSCAWSFATMFAAAFMQLYVLKVLGVAPWKTALIWCLSGVGVWLVSAGWGRLADRHGHRPIINICVTLKSMIVIVFMLLTSENVYLLLPVAFFFDGMLNAGSMVASNGYMLTHSPQRNRSMYIASITGLAGILGGVAAMASGALLKRLGPGTVLHLGRDWNAYQIIFALSLLMRWACIPLARRIRETRASRSLHVLNDIAGENVTRFLQFPVGLYRRFVPEEEGADQENRSPGSGR